MYIITNYIKKKTLIFNLVEERKMNKQKSIKIPFFRKLPKSVYLAFSGGVDSAVLLHRLLDKGMDVKLLHIYHQTSWCDKELSFTTKMSLKYGIPISSFMINKYEKGINKTSIEHYWSQERNKIYQQIDRPVLVGHHLDDASEWYVMSSMQGQSKLLSYQNNNVLRPLIVTEKSKIVAYADTMKIEHLSDPTNDDLSFNLRNKVRHQLLPEMLKVFPGINTTVRRLIISKESKTLLDDSI